MLNSAAESSVSENPAYFDIKRLLLDIWKAKWGIILVVVIVTGFIARSAFNSPDIYTSFAVLAPVQKDAAGMSGLAGQYTGLAAAAGISLGGKESSKAEQAVQYVQSWSFWDELLKKHHVKPEIFAILGWDKGTRSLIYDSTVYSKESDRWLGERGSREPTSWRVYKAIRGKVRVESDKKTGLVTVSVTHFSPSFARFLCALIVTELNLHFQSQDKAEAQRSIEYLTAKIKETPVAEMRAVFYTMVEAQTRSLMLAEVSGEYLLKTVIPPMEPEEKVGPKRFVICVMALTGSTLLCLIFVLGRGLILGRYVLGE